MTHFKKIFTILTLVFLVVASLPLTTFASSTLKTDLINGLVSKSEHLTFDLWAKDAYGQKIEATAIEVLNNNEIVPINWDDKEKTSYTLTLNLGTNHIIISHQSSKLEYNITREHASDGDVIGHFIFSLDGFTIGQGYIIEPIEVPIIKGRNSAQELDEILRKHGFTYKSTGMLENGFYLAAIYSDKLFQKPVIIPDALKAALGGVYDETLYAVETGLGEFDINYMSGWMYSVNNVFPNVGFSDKYMLDGDVMRVQFTLAYGQDIGGGEAMGGDGGSNFFQKVNKDELTRKVAAINTPGKNLYLINSTRINAYKKALQTLQKVNASQSEIDSALNTLKAADLATQSDGSVYKEDEEIVQPSPTPAEPSTNTEERQQANRIISQIQVLPNVQTLTLADAPAVYLARQNYDALSTVAKGLVTNLNKLEQAEVQIKLLQSGANSTITPPIDLPSTNLTDVQKVMALISSLPTFIQISDEVTISNVRKAYDELSSENKLLIMNYSTLLLAEMTLTSLKEEQSATQAKVLNTIRLINAISTTISLKDQVAIEEARASYDKLSAAEKSAVTNYDKLLNAETRLKSVTEQNKPVTPSIDLPNIDLPSTNLTDTQKVMTLISSLPTSIKLSDETTILSARKAYDQLSSENKLLIMNYSTLLLAEMTLSSLKEENNATQAKILQTIRLINAIPTAISLKDQVAIEEARASYDKLSAAEKGAVTNYDKLLNAETSLKSALEQNKPVQQLQQLIDELPKKITLEQTVQLENILKQYEALTAKQQAQVTAIQRVKDALAQLEQEEKDKNEPLEIENGTVNITVTSNSTTIASSQLQQIINDDTINEIKVTNKSGSSFTITKNHLPNNLKDASLTIEEQLITIGANKELLINVKTDQRSLQIPVELKLSQAAFKNGYLLQKNKDGLKATPHFAEGEYIYANILSNQAYVYTTNEVSFNDLQNDIFADDIYYLANRYVVQGSNGNYNSNAPITRADFAVMISRALNATPKSTTKFNDVKGKYYEQAVQALYELKIINGVSETQFNPTAVLSREHAALMMARVLRHAGLKQPSTYKLSYSDIDLINKDYQADIAWLQQLGIMSGNNNQFDPQGMLTRGQMAKILTRTLNAAKIM